MVRRRVEQPLRDAMARGGYFYASGRGNAKVARLNDQLPMSRAHVEEMVTWA